MTKQDNMQDELVALRAEVQSLRESRRKQEPASEEDPNGDVDTGAEAGGEVPEADGEATEATKAEFEQAVGDLVEQIEANMAARPAVTILGALVLGLLLGAAFKR
jgi:hypothetical protein